MSGNVRLLTSGMPTWSASSGTLAFDKTARAVWANYDDAAGWVKIEGLYQVYHDLDALAQKFRLLVAMLIEMGFDELSENFGADYDRSQEEEPVVN